DVDGERDLLLRGEQGDLPEPAQVPRDRVDLGHDGRPLRGGGRRALAHPFPSGRAAVLSGLSWLSWLSWFTSNATTVSDRASSRTVASARYLSPTSGCSPERCTSCQSASR